MLVVDKQPAKSVFFKLIYVCESFEPEYLQLCFSHHFCCFLCLYSQKAKTVYDVRHLKINFIQTFFFFFYIFNKQKKRETNYISIKRLFKHSVTKTLQILLLVFIRHVNVKSLLAQTTKHSWENFIKDLSLLCTKFYRKSIVLCVIHAILILHEENSNLRWMKMSSVRDVQCIS